MFALLQQAGRTRSAKIRIVGDLTAAARSTLEPEGARGTVLRIDWHVRLTSAALTRMDRVAPWIAAPSHAVVMRVGSAVCAATSS